MEYLTGCTSSAGIPCTDRKNNRRFFIDIIVRMYLYVLLLLEQSIIPHKKGGDWIEQKIKTERAESPTDIHMDAGLQPRLHFQDGHGRS